MWSSYSDFSGPNVSWRHCGARCDVSREIVGFLKIFSDTDVRFQAVGPCQPEQSVFLPHSGDSIGPRMLHDDCNHTATANFWRSTIVTPGLSHALSLSRRVCGATWHLVPQTPEGVSDQVNSLAGLDAVPHDRYAGVHDEGVLQRYPFPSRTNTCINPCCPTAAVR